MTYLYLLDLSRGKLINFRSAKVESKFVNTPVPRHARVNFDLRDSNYNGSQKFLNPVVELLRDFEGTANENYLRA